MSISGFSRYALSRCVTAAILSGCGGSQPPIGPSGAMQQSPAIVTRAERGTSWMLPKRRTRTCFTSVPTLLMTFTFIRFQRVSW